MHNSANAQFCRVPIYHTIVISRWLIFLTDYES